MKARAAVMAVVGLFLSAAMALAAFCPICFQSVPEGEKYCSRHKQEMLAKTITTNDEAKIVAVLDHARAQYREQLETLKKFYEERGNSIGLKKVEAELKDYDAGRHVSFVNWEDSIPAPEAKEANADADKLLADADAMKKGTGLLGIVKSKRLGEAAGLYRDILTKYPTSMAVEPAAYALGDYYSSGADKDYARAVKFYEMCYLSNPGTTRNALMRAATVCEDDLGDRENAARYYWMVAYGKTGASTIDKTKAEIRLKGLQKGGFGASYKLEEKAEEAKPLPPVVPAK